MGLNCLGVEEGTPVCMVEWPCRAVFPIPCALSLVPCVWQALLEQTDVRIAEMKKEAYEFKRDIVVGAENFRTGV